MSLAKKLLEGFNESDSIYLGGVSHDASEITLPDDKVHKIPNFGVIAGSYTFEPDKRYIFFKSGSHQIYITAKGSDIQTLPSKDAVRQWGKNGKLKIKRVMK